MKRERILWACPHKFCDYETVQSASISSVSHKCGKGRKVRKLVAQEIVSEPS